MQEKVNTAGLGCSNTTHSKESLSLEPALRWFPKDNLRALGIFCPIVFCMLETLRHAIPAEQGKFMVKCLILLWGDMF